MRASLQKLERRQATNIRKLLDKKSQEGFSLIEIALVLVIIGVIVSAIGIAKETKESSDLTKAYKTVVEPCVAAAVRNNEPAISGVSGCTVSGKVATIADTSGTLAARAGNRLNSKDFTVGAWTTGDTNFTVESNL